jgi:hypothetical protein
VPALHERREGVAQRRARDAQLVREVTFRGQAAAGRKQPEPDCRTQPLDRFLERRRRLDRLEDRVKRRASLHPTKKVPTMR